jgi:MFS family permease
VVGRVLWGYIADRWLDARRMLATLAALMALCSAAAAALDASVPLPLVLLLMAAFGASATGWNGVYLAEVARRAPAGLAGPATGGSLMFTYMGNVVGPLLFGAVAEAAGFGVAYALLAPPLAVTTWVLFRARRQAAAS